MAAGHSVHPRYTISVVSLFPEGVLKVNFYSESYNAARNSTMRLRPARRQEEASRDFGKDFWGAERFSHFLRCSTSNRVSILGYFFLCECVCVCAHADRSHVAKGYTWNAPGAVSSVLRSILQSCARLRVWAASCRCLACLPCLEKPPSAVPVTQRTSEPFPRLSVFCSLLHVCALILHRCALRSSFGPFLARGWPGKSDRIDVAEAVNRLINHRCHRVAGLF